MLKISKSIPIPPKRITDIAETMRKLNIGDSFFIEGFHNNGKFHSTAKRLEIKVTVRNESNGVRVWRTK